jgi:hypothetical protein
MMMMMQEIFDDENNRSLNYTKIDRCQDNICIDNDGYYRQILHLNEHLNIEHDNIKIKILLTNRFRLILFVFLILTSQSNALPVYQSLQSQSLVNYNQQSPSPLPVAMVQLSDRFVYPQQTYKVYRRFPNLNNVPSYSNGAMVQIHDQTNQQQQPTSIIQNSNTQQLTLQLRRERQRRSMIDRMVILFDDDGLLNSVFLIKISFFISIGNGQLTKDELYSMALRSNMFPKFHYYLKQIST